MNVEKKRFYLIEFKSGLWNFEKNENCEYIKENIKSLGEEVNVKVKKLVDDHAKVKKDNMKLELRMKGFESFFILLPKILKEEILEKYKKHYIIVMSDEKIWKPNSKSKISYENAQKNRLNDLVKNSSINKHIEIVNDSFKYHRKHNIFDSIKVYTSTKFLKDSFPIITTKSGFSNYLEDLKKPMI